MIKLIVGRCGYVENSISSLLVFWVREPKRTRLEALKSPAEQMLSMYGGNKKPSKECCLKNKDSKFCPECGSAIDNSVDLWRFKSWIRGLHSRDADSIHDRDWETLF